MKTIKIAHLECILDDEDYDYFCDKDLYLKSYSKRRISYYVYCNRRAIHRIIYEKMNPSMIEEYPVDHINRNPCDNRRINLRQLTSYENRYFNKAKKKGSSRYVGVRKHSDGIRWVASVGGMTLGTYTLEEDAAKAHDLYKATHFANPLRLNFPEYSVVAVLLHK